MNATQAKNIEELMLNVNQEIADAYTKKADEEDFRATVEMERTHELLLDEMGEK